MSIERVEREVTFTMTQNRIRVLIVAEVRLYREGLAASLQGRPNVHVVGMVGSLDEAVAAVSSTYTHVVVLDVAVRRSLAIIHAVRAASPTTRIVAFAVAEVDDEILPCAEAGVVGYVTPDCSADDLVAAVESAARGEVMCSPKTAAMLLRRVTVLSGAGRSSMLSGSLTVREREIAALIEQGLSNKEIAARLHIEVATVKNHVHNILDKLQVATRGEAVACLRRERPGRSLRPTPVGPFAAVRQAP